MEQELTALCALGSRPGLSRITALLTALDHPQQGLGLVHVAGTNGKGSVSMMIAAALSRAGYRCARFSSPHLHRYGERFLLDGRPVAAEKMYAALQQVKSAVPALLEQGEDHPTEFEVLTAMAFLLFRQERAELAVLEVGMGGSYDSTNVVTPLLSVITGIGHDHSAFLGDTLAEIAANKAGIIKPGVPVLVGPMDEAARRVIAARAQALGSRMADIADVQISAIEAGLDGQLLELAIGDWQLPRFRLALNGAYQQTNLALALKSLLLLREQGYHVRDDDIRAAMAEIAMPGRMEIVRREPPIILDAAHNPQGAAALGAALQALEPGRKGLLLCGILDDKDVAGILNPLAECCSAAIITRPQGERAGDWRRAAHYWQRRWPERRLLAEEDRELALQAALQWLPGHDYLLICGSFYLLGPLRAQLLNA